MNIKYTTINKSISQDAFNNSIISLLDKVNIDYYSISKEQQHNCISSCIKHCNRCHKNCTKFLPRYITGTPDSVVISRANISRVKRTQLDKNSYTLLEKLLLILKINLNNSYYTNTCMCNLIKVNDVTENEFLKCSLYKELELSTLEKIPKIIFLVGNDALNTFLKKGTITSQIGMNYIAEYLGDYRLFVPIVHPVYLHRDRELLKVQVEQLKILSKVLDAGLLDNLNPNKGVIKDGITI